MKRIDTSSAIDIGGGKLGFTDGNSGTGTPATDLDASFFNNIQEELAHIVEQSGETLDGSDTTQVYTALNALFGSGGTVSDDVGSGLIWFTDSEPANHLECDGSALSRTVYAELFAVIGTVFGSGDGSTTFNLPDLRGYFLRGWDNGRGVDSGRVFGSSQDDAYESHSHSASYSKQWGNSTTGNSSVFIMGASADGSGSFSISSSGSSETRPKNVSIMFCIKYQ